MRTQRSSSARMWLATMPSPSSSVSSARRAVRCSSTGAASASASGAAVGVSSAGASAAVSSADDNRITLPPGGHVLVLDALLQEDDALEQRLGPRRAPGDVDVDGDDLVDALRDRVAVPIRSAAVRAAAHRDDVLRVRHLLVEPADGGDDLVGDGAGDDDEVG